MHIYIYVCKYGIIGLVIYLYNIGDTKRVLFQYRVSPNTQGLLRIDDSNKWRVDQSHTLETARMTTGVERVCVIRFAVFVSNMFQHEDVSKPTLAIFWVITIH